MSRFGVLVFMFQLEGFRVLDCSSFQWVLGFPQIAGPDSEPYSNLAISEMLVYIIVPLTGNSVPIPNPKLKISLGTESRTFSFNGTT